MSPKKNTNKAVNVNISSQKDVDAYVQFCDSLNGITNKNKLKQDIIYQYKMMKIQYQVLFLYSYHLLFLKLD